MRTKCDKRLTLNSLSQSALLVCKNGQRVTVPYERKPYVKYGFACPNPGIVYEHRRFPMGLSNLMAHSFNSCGVGNVALVKVYVGHLISLASLSSAIAIPGCTHILPVPPEMPTHPAPQLEHAPRNL
jgi:hypothetical protein